MAFLLIMATTAAHSAAEGDTFEGLWAALASDDAAAAHEAVDEFSRTPGAVRFLAERLRPVQFDPECIRALADDLDARDFRLRAYADRELRRTGGAGVPELERLTDGSRSAEVRARLRRIALEATGLPVQSSETLRTLRAVNALERAGSRAASDVLASLARGAPGAWETEAARRSLTRIQDCGFEDTPVAAPRPVPEAAARPLAIAASVLRPLRTFTCATHAFDAAFHPDAVHIAGAGSMGKKGVIKIWDSGSGREVASLDHAFAVMSVAFSPDGRLLLAAGGAVPDGDEGGVVLWRLEPEVQPLHLASRASAYYRAVFSADGRWIAAAAHDGQVQIWQTASGTELFVLDEHAGAVFDLAFSPDGRWLASASGERYNSNRPGEVQVLELASGQTVLRLAGHTRPVFGVAFSPDSRWLATAAADDTIRLWSVADGRPIGTYHGHDSAAYSVAFHPDGRHLASAGVRGDVQIWSARTFRQTARLRGNSSSRTYRLAFSRDGMQLLSGGPRRDIHLWDVPAAALRP